MISIDYIIEELVGKKFEIDCFDIEANSEVYEEGPLFKGPGTIFGEKNGFISFRLHNQLEIRKEVFEILSKSKLSETIGKDKLVQISAKDYLGRSWSGSWAIPFEEFSLTYQSIIRGNFHQLTCRLEKQFDDGKKNVGELIFGELFELPLTKMVEETIVRGDEHISSKRWYDSHEINFKGSTIAISENRDSKRTHIIYGNTEKFSFPLMEIWIAESLTLILSKIVNPRLVIRHFEKDALVFLRYTNKDNRSAMPRPLAGVLMKKEELWNIFIAYLEYCSQFKDFDINPITKIFSQVVIASTGTTQAFMLSLSLCVENLVKQLENQLDVKVIDEDSYDALLNKIISWDGKKEFKDRAIGLISMIKNKSTSACLNKLIEQKIIGPEHKRIWSKVRPYLAHGGILDYSESEEIWGKQNILIAMVYRLIYRIINYKGRMIDFSDPDWKVINFDW